MNQKHLTVYAIYLLAGALIPHVKASVTSPRVTTFHPPCTSEPCDFSKPEGLGIQVKRQFGQLDEHQATVGGVQWVSKGLLRVFLDKGIVDLAPDGSLTSPLSSVKYPPSETKTYQVQGVMAGGTQALKSGSTVLVADSNNTNDWVVVPDSAGVWSLSVSENGKYIALTWSPTFQASCALRIYSYQNGDLVPILDEIYHEGTVTRCNAIFSPSDNSVIYSAAANRIYAMKFDGRAAVVTEVAQLADNLNSKEDIVDIYLDPAGKTLLVTVIQNYVYFIQLTQPMQLLSAFPIISVFDNQKTVTPQQGGACFSSDSQYIVIPTTDYTTVGRFLSENILPESIMIIDMKSNTPKIRYHAEVPSEWFGNGNVCSFDPSNPMRFVLTQFRVEVDEPPRPLAIRRSSSITIMGIREFEEPSVAPRLKSSTAPGGSSNTKKSEKACFPGSSLVDVQGTGLVEMRTLNVGDRVRVDEAKFSDIFTWTHKVDGLYEFVSLVTPNNTLRVSFGHFVETTAGLVAAKNIQIGDDLLDGQNGGHAEVVAIKLSWEEGLYNPQTLDGRIVVNGIVASTYTEAVSPYLAHLFLWPARVFYTVTGWSLFGSVFYGAEDINQIEKQFDGYGSSLHTTSPL